MERINIDEKLENAGAVTQPEGTCACGCGGKTKLARDTITKTGQVAGQPQRFIYGHNHAGISTLQGGPTHPRWKGGRVVEKNGYVKITVADHPHATPQGRVYEHRLVMEAHLGRYLLPEEQVHHKGTKYPRGSVEDRGDNRIENLQLMPSRAAHVREHARYERSDTEKQCGKCLKKLSRTAFWKCNRPGKDPHQSWCKECASLHHTAVKEGIQDGTN